MISIQLPVVLFQVALIAVRANESIATQNSCQIGTSQDGCRYVLSFQPSESHCHSVSDFSESRHHPSNPSSSSQAPSNDEAALTVKKLDHLEQKLTRMMEELSVRSLRHIRQIKIDLRQLMTSVRDIKVKQTRPPTAGSGNVIAGAGRAGVPCLPEFVRVGPWPSCYRFSLFNATWHEAREYCSAFGANLLALDSLKEAHIIDYLIKSNPGNLGFLALSEFSPLDSSGVVLWGLFLKLKAYIGLCHSYIHSFLYTVLYRY